jgi:hypothetical protein
VQGVYIMGIGWKAEFMGNHSEVHCSILPIHNLANEDVK